MSMAVSTAKVDITPSLDANPYMAGYGCDDTPRVATTAMPHAQPLAARCVVLWDGGVPRAIVSVEVLAIPRSMNKRIRASVRPLHPGWTDGDLMLLATHTHNGPVLVEKLDPWITYNLDNEALSKVAAYSTALEQKIVDLVRTALQAPQTPCRLDYKVDDENFAVNRAGLKYVERDVPILTARGTDGKPVAVLFGYGCHPTSAVWKTTFDGDWIGGACAYIESQTQRVFPLFLQGACGDQNPAKLDTEGSWANRDFYAQDLGKTVKNALATAGRPLAGIESVTYREADLPLDVTKGPGLQAVKAAFQTRDRRTDLHGWMHRDCKEMIKWIDEGRVPTSMTVPIQVWKLAAANGGRPLRIAMTGGEVVSGYAKYFRDRYGSGDGIWFGGYANEIEAYIPTNELLPPLRQGGSYEGGWDADSQGIGGGSMMVYCWPAHFKAGAGGAEAAFINAVSAML